MSLLGAVTSVLGLAARPGQATAIHAHGLVQPSKYQNFAVVADIDQSYVMVRPEQHLANEGSVYNVDMRGPLSALKYHVVRPHIFLPSGEEQSLRRFCKTTHAHRPAATSNLNKVCNIQNVTTNLVKILYGSKGEIGLLLPNGSSHSQTSKGLLAVDYNAMAESHLEAKRSFAKIETTLFISANGQLFSPKSLCSANTFTELNALSADEILRLQHEQLKQTFVQAGLPTTTLHTFCRETQWQDNINSSRANKIGTAPDHFFKMFAITGGATLAFGLPTLALMLVCMRVNARGRGASNNELPKVVHCNENAATKQIESKIKALEQCLNALNLATTNDRLTLDDLLDKAPESLCCIVTHDIMRTPIRVLENPASNGRAAFYRDYEAKSLLKDSVESVAAQSPDQTAANSTRQLRLTHSPSSRFPIDPNEPEFKVNTATQQRILQWLDQQLTEQFSKAGDAAAVSLETQADSMAIEMASLTGEQRDAEATITFRGSNASTSSSV